MNKNYFLKTFFEDSDCLLSQRERGISQRNKINAVVALGRTLVATQNNSTRKQREIFILVIIAFLFMHRNCDAPFGRQRLFQFF